MIKNERFTDEEDAFRAMLESHQAGLWTALPCLIDSVDLTEQTVSAQPTIKGTVKNQDGTTTEVDLPLLVDVPVMFPRAGGFALTFPIAEGDECLVVFASRCIDSWWQSGGIQSQAEKRMHDLSDGFCFLAPTSQPNKLANVSTQHTDLRNEAGDQYVRLQNNKTIRVVNPEGTFWIASTGQFKFENDNALIYYQADGDIEMTTKSSGARIDIEETTGNVTLTAGSGGKIYLNGDVDIAGNTQLYFGKTLVTGVGINLVTHKHADPVSGDTGVPKT